MPFLVWIYQQYFLRKVIFIQNNHEYWIVPLIYDAFIEGNKVFRFKYVTNIPMKDYIYNKCLYK